MVNMANMNGQHSVQHKHMLLHIHRAQQTPTVQT